MARLSTPFVSRRNRGEERVLDCATSPQNLDLRIRRGHPKCGASRNRERALRRTARVPLEESPTLLSAARPRFGAHFNAFVDGDRFLPRWRDCRRRSSLGVTAAKSAFSIARRRRRIWISGAGAGTRSAARRATENVLFAAPPASPSKNHQRCFPRHVLASAPTSTRS